MQHREFEKSREVKRHENRRNCDTHYRKKCSKGKKRNGKEEILKKIMADNFPML